MEVTHTCHVPLSHVKKKKDKYLLLYTCPHCPMLKFFIKINICECLLKKKMSHCPIVPWSYVLSDVQYYLVKNII